MPALRTDRMLIQGWTIVTMHDEVGLLEIWRLKDLRREFYRRRGALRRPLEYRDTCAACAGPKDAFSNLRSDVGAMFNYARMEEFLEEAPKVLDRQRRRGYHTVTVEHGAGLKGKLGGHTAGSYRRDTPSFDELREFAIYDDRLRFLVLGGDTKEPIVLEQHRGTAIGGRFSRTKTAVFLGRRAWRYLRDLRARERDRFLFPGYALWEVVAILQYVDDGSFGSFMLCRSCLFLFACRLWGEDMAVSLEEEGARENNYRMRFLDSVEEFDETTGQFSLTPWDKNEAPLIVGSDKVPITRYQGPAYTGHGLRYARSLILGRLARIHQLTDDRGEVVESGLGRVLVELVEAGFGVATLRRALSSIREEWAQPAIQALQGTLREAQE